MRRAPNRLSLGVATVSAATAVVWLTLQLTPPAPGLLSGIYFGWSDGRESHFQLLGDACSAADPITAFVLLAPGGTARTGLAASQTAADLAFGPAVPVIDIDAAGLGAAQGYRRAAVRCRSGSGAELPIGAASVALLAPSAGAPAELGIAVARRAVGDALLGVITLHNPGEAALRLQVVDYSPPQVSTGRVWAAAGNRAQVALWADLALAGSEEVVADPTALSPWHAAYQALDDPRRLLLRDAARLDLLVGPAEWAVLVIDHRSFAVAASRLPVLLYPVIRYRLAGQEHALGLNEAVYGWLGGAR